MNPPSGETLDLEDHLSERKQALLAQFEKRRKVTMNGQMIPRSIVCTFLVGEIQHLLPSNFLDGNKSWY